MLLVASILLIFIGAVHSLLGEKYLILRLLKRDNLPKLFGGDEFTKQLIRFAWHLTTLAWWAIAAILWVFWGGVDAQQHIILQIIAVTFVLSGTLALVASKGKHLSWIIFYAISICCFLSL